MSFVYSEMFRSIDPRYAVYLNRIQDPVQLYLEAYGVSGHLIAYQDVTLERLICSGFMMQLQRLDESQLAAQCAGTIEVKNEVVAAALERLRPLMQEGMLCAEPALVAVASPSGTLLPDALQNYVANLHSRPLGYVSLGGIEAARVVSKHAQQEGAAFFLKEMAQMESLHFPVTHALVVNDGSDDAEHHVSLMKALGAMTTVVGSDA